MRLRLAVLLLLVPSVAEAGGLYIRLGAGPGVSLGSDVIDGEDVGQGAVDVSTEISVGKEIEQDLVVGGGEYSMAVFAPGLHLFSFGPFVEYSYDSFHAQAALTIGTGYHEGKQGFDGAAGFGYGASAGVEFDLKRFGEWRFGPLLRFTYYHWSGGDYTLDQASPSLLLAFTYRSNS